MRTVTRNWVGLETRRSAKSIGHVETLHDDVELALGVTAQVVGSQFRDDECGYRPDPGRPGADHRLSEKEHQTP